MSPTPNEKKPLLKPVDAPLSNTRLSRLIYLLVVLTAASTVYYSWRVLQWKTEAGGWWNYATGAPPKAQSSHSAKKGAKAAVDDSVEAHIHALALSLGVPTPDLARAIAGAVRAYVPPASLSSVSEAAQATDGKLSPVLEELLRESEPSDAPHVAASTTSAGVMQSIAAGMDGFVGMEEP